MQKEALPFVQNIDLFDCNPTRLTGQFTTYGLAAIPHPLSGNRPLGIPRSRGRRLPAGRLCEGTGGVGPRQVDQRHRLVFAAQVARAV